MAKITASLAATLAVAAAVLGAAPGAAATASGKHQIGYRGGFVNLGPSAFLIFWGQW